MCVQIEGGRQGLGDMGKGEKRDSSNHYTSESHAGPSSPRSPHQSFSMCNTQPKQLTVTQRRAFQLRPEPFMRSHGLYHVPRICTECLFPLMIHMLEHNPQVKVKVSDAQLCPILCNSMDCSPAGSSVHGILQARLLEWVAISFSRGSSGSTDRTQVSCITGGGAFGR